MAYYDTLEAYTVLNAFTHRERGDEILVVTDSQVYYLFDTHTVEIDGQTYPNYSLWLISPTPFKYYVDFYSSGIPDPHNVPWWSDGDCVQLDGRLYYYSLISVGITYDVSSPHPDLITAPSDVLALFKYVYPMLTNNPVGAKCYYMFPTRTKSDASSLSQLVATGSSNVVYRISFQRNFDFRIVRFADTVVDGQTYYVYAFCSGLGVSGDITYPWVNYYFYDGVEHAGGANSTWYYETINGLKYMYAIVRVPVDGLTPLSDIPYHNEPWTVSAIVDYMLFDKTPYIVEGSELLGIANAIRTKGGTSDPLAFPLAFVSAIQAIPSGVTPSGSINISQNGTYDVSAFADAVVSVGGSDDNYLLAIGAMSGSIYDDVTVNVPINAFLCKPTLIGVNMPAVKSVGNHAFHQCTGLTQVSFPICETIGASAFTSCGSLSTANFPNCTSVGFAAFNSCVRLTEALFPVCKSIDLYTFSRCDRLTTISFPSCEVIGEGAFVGCYSLVVADFPVCTDIGRSAFSGCRNLSSLSFPVCSYVGSYAFMGTNISEAYFPSCLRVFSQAFALCSRLTTVSFPICLSADAGAFQNCSSLINVSLPNCTYFAAGALSRCSVLSKVELPRVGSLLGYAFAYCSGLVEVSLPACSRISGNDFVACYNLLSVHLLASSVATLVHINAFSSTPISNYTTSTGGVYGSIFVPASLVDAYKSAVNWSVYSDRIAAYTEQLNDN